MKKHLQIIGRSLLFSGMAPEEISLMLHCLEARTASYQKGETLLRVGKCASTIGLVLDGCVQIVQEDFWGNRNIVAKALPGQSFAEAFACAEATPLTVSVVAEVPAEVLSLNVRRILTTCSASCVFHSRMIQNLLRDLAGKNLAFSEKMAHMTQRSTRNKLLSYLSAEAMRKGSPAFEIPYNRQQLADYLSVERSAMSSELGRMRDDGILSFEKNRFLLKKPYEAVE